jgi:predicted hydrocarbon binding protein
MDELIHPYMDELIGLRIFISSFLTEIEKTFGTSTVKAILNRMGHKPGEITADHYLSKYNKDQENPFEIPSTAFNLFEKSISQLYQTEVINQSNLQDRIIIKIKNICAFHEVIKSNENLGYNGTLCEFTIGYFETALKNLTGLKVEYEFVEKETTDEFCVVNIIFHKKNIEVESTSATDEQSDG